MGPEVGNGHPSSQTPRFTLSLARVLRADIELPNPANRIVKNMPTIIVLVAAEQGMDRS